MKKIYLSMLALFCCFGAFAQNLVFTATGNEYNSANNSFGTNAYVTVGYSEGKLSVSNPNGQSYSIPNFDLNEGEQVVRSWGVPEGGTQYNYCIYVTRDGSNPADPDNVWRICVFNQKENPLEIYSVNIAKSSVIKAALVRESTPYYYDEDHRTLGNIFTGYDYTKQLGETTEEFVQGAFQSYVGIYDVADWCPTISFDTENCTDPINEPTKSFVNSAAVKISSDFELSEDVKDYVYVGFGYTLDGTAVNNAFDGSGLDSPGEASESVNNTTDVRAQLWIYAKRGTLDENGDIFEFNYCAGYSPKEAAAKFTKLELTSADGVVFEHNNFVGDDQAFVLTWGVNVKNIKYNGDIYSVLTDGKSSFLVKNGGFKEEQVYYVGGNYAWYSDLFMPMFEKDFYYSRGYYNEYIKLAPTMLSEDNMNSFIYNQNTQPLVNVGFLVEDFDAETGTATVGGQTVEVVNAADIAAAIPTDKPSLYNGDATITGIIFGHPHNSGKVLVYADAITQGPQLTVSAPEITLEKEKNVDSTKDLTVTVCFDDYEIINPDLDAAEVELYGNAQLRTVDGKAIGDPIPYEAQKLGEPFELTIGSDQITPDLAYIITIDGVTAQTTPILYETEFDNASKSFVTKAPAILNQSVSVFDGVVTATVLNVETVGINDESEIKLYNNATGEEVEYEAIDASGNQIILTVGDGGFSVDVPFVTGLNFGQYTLILGPEALTVDEFINPKELRFEITAGDETDKARIDALSDLNRCWTVLNNAPVGVNIFQYLPATVKKFQTVVDEVLDEVLYTNNPLAAADDIKMANTKLLTALYNFRPTLPEVNKTYTIRTNYRVYDEEKDEMVPTLGKYLNIDGEKVVLSKTPSYIQFHMVENCFDEYYEALLHMDPTNERFGGNPDMWGRFCYAPYTWYLYNTTNRSYVYMEQSDLKHNEEWDYDYYNYVLTDNRRIASTFTFQTAGFNEWLMDAVNYIDLGIHAYDGLPVLYHNDDVFTWWDFDKIDEIEDFDSYYYQLMDGKCAWYIEQVDEPKPLNIPEGYIALTDEAELEGQTVVLMNVDTEEFIYGKDAQNIAVADFETASASTNVVTSYKIEKADNGFLFRCVTPDGADYGLWGANPCYFNAQPNVGGVTFNLGKDQDVANGSTWSLTYDEDARAWIVQCVANKGYLAGSTTSTEVTAKWVICASTSNASSEEATSISSVEAAANASAIFNAAGARTNTLQKGLNIVKMANGQVKKVMVK